MYTKDFCHSQNMIMASKYKIKQVANTPISTVRMHKTRKKILNIPEGQSNIIVSQFEKSY